MPVKRKPQPDDTMDLDVLGRSFIETDDTAKLFSNKVATIKKRLMEILEKGDPDEDGHIWAELRTPIESVTTGTNGKRREETVTGFKREKRKSRYLDAELAEAWAKKHKLWDEVAETVTVTTVVEDKLWLLVMEGKASEEEINELYGENVTFALTRVTE